MFETVLNGASLMQKNYLPRMDYNYSPRLQCVLCFTPNIVGIRNNKIVQTFYNFTNSIIKNV